MVDSTKPLLRTIIHAHTTFSPDSTTTPKQLVEACIDHGIDAIAVTDHDTIKGAQAVAQIAPFQVIIGEEIHTSEGGELLGLFLREHVSAGMSATETIRRIKDQGGVVGVSHPFDRLRDKSFSSELLDSIAPQLDFVETFNARNIGNESDRLAEEFARRHNIPGIAGSDAHLVSEIGRVFLLMPPFSNADEFRASLPAAKVASARRTHTFITAWRLIRHGIRKIFANMKT